MIHLSKDIEAILIIKGIISLFFLIPYILLQIFLIYIGDENFIFSISDESFRLFVSSIIILMLFWIINIDSISKFFFILTIWDWNIEGTITIFAISTFIIGISWLIFSLLIDYSEKIRKEEERLLKIKKAEEARRKKEQERLLKLKKAKEARKRDWNLKGSNKQKV